MIKSLYTKGSQQISKFYAVCDLLNKLPSKIPSNLKYKSTPLDVIEIMNTTTENMDKDLLGLFISSGELKSISRYLMDNEEEFMQDISVVCHNRQKRGAQCSLSEADFAEIRIAGKERTLLIHANAMNITLGKVGSYIEINNTSWKKLKMYTSDKNKRDVILERIIIEAALMEETKTGTKYKTEEQFMKLFNSTEALEPREVSKYVGQNLYKREGTLGIYKMIYNKIKNDSLPVKQLTIIDNHIHIIFDNNNKDLGFIIGMGKLIIS